MKKILLIIGLMGAGLCANAQWTVQASGFAAPSRGITDISAVNSNIVWAVAYNGVTPTNPVQDFTRTLNGGTTWTRGVVNGAANLNFANISAINKDTAWVAMYNGTAGGGGLFRTNNGGVSWTQQTTATFTPPNGFPDLIYFWDANNGVAVGDPNGGYFEIYTTTNGGTTWTRVPQVNIPNPNASEFGLTNLFTVVGNTIWFGTTTGRVFKSTNMGLNWTAVSSGLTNMTDMAMKDANNGLCHFNGTMKKTTDGGTTWTSVTPTGFLQLDLDVVPGTNTYFCTGAGAVRGSAYSNDGVTWTNVDTIQHLAIGFVNGTTGWSGGFNTDSVTGGMFKWNGVNLSVNNLGGTKTHLNVYPNPASELVYVQMDNADNGPVKVSIIDMLGNTVLQNVYENGAGFFMRSFSVSALAKGIYLVNLENGTNYFQQKIVVH